MKRVTGQPKSFTQRIAWLFTKDGLPALAAIAVGFILGMFVHGALGLVLATVAGLLVLKAFKQLPIRLNPWQALVTDASPIIAKMFFMMIFLLPVANHLTLPTGHNPDTFTKYVSIIIALPKNLITGPARDFFPGFPFIVIISIFLMVWGSMNLGKMKNWALAFVGLLLYTFSPTITAAIKGDVGLQISMSFFSIGYYLAWVGLILIIVHKAMPHILKTTNVPVRSPNAMLNIVPPVVAMAFLSQHNMIDFPQHLPLLPVFDFESLHHGIAAGFSGAIAGIGAGAIVEESFGGNEAPPSEESFGGNEAPPIEEVPDSENVVPQGPQPSTDPEDPPGTTIQNNQDGTITKRRPDGTVATKYSDGTIYAETPDGNKTTLYPDGTLKTWVPDGSTQIDRPDGTTEITNPDGKKGIIYPDGKNVTTKPDGEVITIYPDGKLKSDLPDGSSKTWDKDNNLISAITGSESKIPGLKINFNPDRTGDATFPNGDRLTLDKDGNFNGGSMTTDGLKYTANKDGSGDITDPTFGTLKVDKDFNLVSANFNDGKGNKLTLKEDGSFEAETAAGDKIKSDINGVKATFKDGGYYNADPDGKPIGGHFKDENGATVDIKTDENGTTHVNDDKGNSMEVNKDGSGKYKYSDGTTASQDSKGNTNITAPNGTKFTANADGTGTIEATNGNKMFKGKDGSYTLKETNGKTTSYSPEQIDQMSPEQIKETLKPMM